MSGTILAQLFTLALYPVLTHLYTPAEFGIYGLFSAILLTVATLANGGYNNTIMLPKKNSDAYNLFMICGVFVLAVSLLSLIIILLFQELIEGYITKVGSNYWLLLLPLSIFLEGFYFSLSALLNREGNYKALTTAKIFQALVSGLVSVAMGFWFSNLTGGLIIGMVAGQFASFMQMTFMVGRSFPKEKVNWYQLKVIAKEYKDFPKYGLASSYLNTLSRQIPFYIIPLYFTTEVLGNFTLAHKILTAPLTFIGSSVSMIYYQKAAQAKKENALQLKELNTKLSLGFAAVSFFPVLVVILFGPQIFSFVFGEDYENAGKYARWIVMWIAMMYILNPLSFLVDIYGKLKMHLVYNVILFIARITILIVGGMLFNAEASIALFGLTGFLFSLGLFVWLLKLGSKPH